MKRLDGIGSNKQVVDFEEFTNFDNVAGEIISNCEKMIPWIYCVVLIMGINFIYDSLL